MNALPSTEYVYGATPPVTAPRVIDPLETPQAALTTVAGYCSRAGCISDGAEVENTQPFASLTSTA